MAIPDYQKIMLPLLQFSSDGKIHNLSEAREYLAHKFKLTDEDRKELLPSGSQYRFDNRVHWARSYMKQAGLLENPSRGSFKITERGIDVIQSNPKQINVNFLMKFEEFVDFRSRGKKQKDFSVSSDILELGEQTTEETLESSYKELRDELAQELLDFVMNCNYVFFENLVVELLLKMGYGGSRKDAGEAIGKTSDEGVDGIIKEDRLGLDVIYIQAKKWQKGAVVGRPEIQKFVGALAGKQARKGIFITTSHFSKEAKNYGNDVDVKVILIDGEYLAQLMIDFDIGVSSVATYQVKKIDPDYFEG